MRSVSLWHPFTARAVGWQVEAELPSFHSRPHVTALADLTASGEIVGTVEYLTDRHLPWRIHRDGLTWRLWPRSRRLRSVSSRFGHEYSYSALLQCAARPADVTIINTSGHGGRLPRDIGAAVLRRHR